MNHNTGANETRKASERTTAREQTKHEKRANDTTTGDDTDHGTNISADGLAGTRGKLDTCLVVVRELGDNGGVVAGRARERAAVTDLSFLP